MSQRRMTDRELLEAIRDRVQQLVIQKSGAPNRAAAAPQRRMTDRELMEAILEQADLLVKRSARSASEVNHL